MSDTKELTELFEDIAKKIIAQQEAIIGPIAVDRAKLVKGLQVNWSEKSVDVTGDQPEVINELVEQYKELFGQIAVETCRETVHNLVARLPGEQQPSTLK